MKAAATGRDLRRGSRVSLQSNGRAGRVHARAGSRHSRYRCAARASSIPVRRCVLCDVRGQSDLLRLCGELLARRVPGCAGREVALRRELRGRRGAHRGVETALRLRRGVAQTGPVADPIPGDGRRQSVCVAQLTLLRASRSRRTSRDRRARRTGRRRRPETLGDRAPFRTHCGTTGHGCVSCRRRQDVFTDICRTRPSWMLRRRRSSQGAAQAFDVDHAPRECGVDSSCGSSRAISPRRQGCGVRPPGTCTQRFGTLVNLLLDDQRLTGNVESGGHVFGWSPVDFGKLA